MHLVCSGCQFHSKNAKIVECPRCGLDLDDLSSLRTERRPQKILRQATPSHRSAKRSWRRDVKELEAF